MSPQTNHTELSWYVLSAYAYNADLNVQCKLQFIVISYHIFKSYLNICRNIA